MDHTNSGISSRRGWASNKCNTYYCNVGAVNNCECKTKTGNKMNVKSAQQGRRPIDLLSKRERAKMRRQDQQLSQKGENSVIDCPSVFTLFDQCFPSYFSDNDYYVFPYHGKWL